MNTEMDAEIRTARPASRPANRIVSSIEAARAERWGNSASEEPASESIASRLREATSICASKAELGFYALLALGTGLLTKPLLAFAHHPLEGRAPRTLLEGLLSGLAHPVIELEHFVFLLAVGVACVRAPRWGFAGPALFALGSLIGAWSWERYGTAWIPSLWILLPTLILMGAWLGIASSSFRVSQKLRGRTGAMILALGLCGSGIAHGFFFGEGILGAQPGPLNAYLLGLGFSCASVGILAFLCARTGLAKGLPQRGLNWAVGAACWVIAAGLLLGFSA